jgi:hypothetical protein
VEVASYRLNYRTFLARFRSSLTQDSSVAWYRAPLEMTDGTKMATHKGPASLRPRCTRSGSSVAAIPVYPPRYATVAGHLQICLKSDSNVGHYVWTYVLLTAVGNILSLYNNTKSIHCYILVAALNICIAEGYTYVNSTKQTNCCVSMTTMITRTRHSFTRT